MPKARPSANRNGNSSPRQFTTQTGLNSYIWSIWDILRRSNGAGALQYVPKLTWILFLRILDDRKALEAERAEAVGMHFTPSLEPPYRWRDWAAPPANGLTLEEAACGEKLRGWKRKELQEGALGAFFGFVNGELLPYLKGLRDWPNTTPRQKVIAEILQNHLPSYYKTMILHLYDRP